MNDELVERVEEGLPVYLRALGLSDAYARAVIAIIRPAVLEEVKGRLLSTESVDMSGLIEAARIVEAMAKEGT